MGKKGVLEKAKKLELKGTQKNVINSDRIPDLEEILRDVYTFCHPKPVDYFNRKDLVRIFNVMAKEIYGNSNDIPVVEEFGSFLMDIFSAQSDLDLSVNFNNKGGDFPQEKKIQSLRKFAKKFYALRRKGHVSNVQPIFAANVPILKIVDGGTGIECDISIENRDGILKSQIVRMVSSIDERFQMLCFLMKVWAKAHGINSSKDRTLNSLSIISLVAFHLQTRDPPILPPFSAIFKDEIDSASVEKMVNSFSDFGKMNKESLAELFVTLLVKLASVEPLWPKGLCASIYEGSWIYKTWESPSKKKLDSKFGFISVEDFTDRSLNVARVVGKKQVQKIYKVIHASIYYISVFMEGGIQVTKLRERLFGTEYMPALDNRSTTTADSHISLDPTVTKRMRIAGGLGGTEGSISFVQTKIVHWGGPPTKGWDVKIIGGRGGEHVSIHLDQMQPKPVQSTVIWRGPPVEGWKGDNVSIQLDQIQPKPVLSTSVWRGPPVGGWGGEHLSIHNAQIEPKPVQSMVVWRGKPMEGWGEKHVSVHLDQVKPKGVQSTVVWGGTPVEGWGAKHVSTQLDQIRPKAMETTEAWGGIQRAALPKLIWAKGMQSADGWRQWEGNSTSCASAKHRSVPTKKPIGIRASSRYRQNTERSMPFTPYSSGCSSRGFGI